jgi:acetyl esterase/lipase
MLIPLLSGFRRAFKASQLNAMAKRIFDTPPPPPDARAAYGPAPQQFGDLRLPPGEGPHPVMVMIHGGFWRARYDLDHTGHMCAALTSEDGIATWNIEFRRVGDVGGAWPNTLRDVGLAVDHLRKIATKYNLDLDRVVVAGHSAGGHLALWSAGRHRIPEGDPLYIPDPLPVRAAVSLAGAVDLGLASRMRLSNGATEELMGGSPEDMPERYATASPGHLLPLGVKQVLIHGTRDPDVPYEISQFYVERAQSLGDDATLISLKGAGHFEVIDPASKEFGRVRGAVLSCLGASEGQAK